MEWFFVGRRLRVSLSLVGFVVLLRMMVIFFWECTFPPLVEIRENPEFHPLMREDKAHWPRCLLWHGWLPMLSGVNGASPWAAHSSESAFYLVETSLGQCSSRLPSDWNLPDGFGADEVSAHMPDSPDIWSDGSLVMDSVTGVSAAGAGIFAQYPETCWGYSHVHLFVADVVKSFDTVDRGVLDAVLSSLGLPGCFVMLTLSTMLMSGNVLSWHLVLVSPGLVMVALLRAVS